VKHAARLGLVKPLDHVVVVSEGVCMGAGGVCVCWGGGVTAEIWC
jgi:hypothetical protein